ncbi:MAG: class I SAM-dependent methyltransferase [Chloroflexota bacterium]
MRFEGLKARQSAIWGSAPWERVAETLADLHDDLVARLRPQRSEHWLDLATGTGAVAIRASRAGAQVTALDLAPALIDTAKRLAADQALSIRFDVGDCEKVPYADASFDVVSSAVGVIFAPDHVAVARELARVCRPGGRLGLASWRPNPSYSAVIEPFRAPVEPGAGDPNDWGREDYVLELLGDAFELEFAVGECPLRGESGQAIWQLFTGSHGNFKALVESLAHDRREELHRAFVDYLERYRVDGSIRAPDDYLLVLGKRR